MMEQDDSAAAAAAAKVEFSEAMRSEQPPGGEGEGVWPHGVVDMGSRHAPPPCPGEPRASE